MRVRYESFGGIIALDKPPATIYVDRAYMKELGYSGSPLWQAGHPYLSAPVTAHFAVTARCPMGCRTCYNGSGTARSDELSTAEAKGVLDVLADMRVFTVAFGGGEPLVRPDLFELARYARRQGITSTMTTNGFYVNFRTALRCRAFSHVHVSLDGIGKIYRAVRGVDGFKHAARALKLLRRAGVPVGVNCVVCRANFDHLEELVQFVCDCGVQDVIFLRFKPNGRARSSYERLQMTAEQRRAFYPRLEKLTRRYDLHSHVDCAMMPFIYWHHPGEQALRLYAGEGCIGANEIVEIAANGQVRACSFATQTAGTASCLPDFWNTAHSLELYRRWTQIAPEPCRSCDHLALCHGGCHAIAEALTGDFNAPDPECPFVEQGGWNA